MKPSELTIGDLLHARQPFEIPKYQRAYAWEIDNLDDFITDLEICWVANLEQREARHFFGGIVSIHHTHDNIQGRKYDVVDGQQRLATFVLLLSLLQRAFDNLASSVQLTHGEIASTAGREAKHLQDSYVFYDDPGRDIRPFARLVLSRADREFFDTLIRGLSPTPERASHKRLLAARDALWSRLLGPTLSAEGRQPQQILAALQALRHVILDSCYVIHLVAESSEEAYKLFQVLNDRGITLTEGDLLRSSTLERLESFPRLQELGEKAWDAILSDDNTTTEQFLRTYFSSMVGRRPGKRSLFDEFSKELFSGVVSTLEDAEDLLRRAVNLQYEFGLFQQLLDCEWPYVNSVVTAWDRTRLGYLVKSLKHTLCLPLLLAARQLDESDFSRIVQLLERFVFRYVIICRSHVGKLTETYYRHCRAIRTNPSGYDVGTLRSDLQTLQLQRATDTTFRPLLGEVLRYRDRGSNQYLRYFLVTIEQFTPWCDSPSPQGAPVCSKKALIFDLNELEIEHVYPQHASGCQPGLESLKHDLGNLTFWGPQDNQSAGNAEFPAKVLAYSKSSIALTREITSYATWTAASVEARRKSLEERALRIFTV